MQRLFENKHWKIDLADNEKTLYLTKKKDNVEESVMILNPSDKIVSGKNMYLVGDLLTVLEAERRV